ncbi:MAG: aldehyde dehydrogenase family protein [Nitrospirales bacterium]|nr:aldehyde dehydrogenase family protein [Nitrospirales bacterium]
MSSAPFIQPFLLGNEWQTTAARTPVTNPYNGQVIAEVCQAGPTEATQALNLAMAAFHQLRQLPAYVKATALENIAGTIRTRQEELAKTMSLEAGKPITDARREVGRTIHTFSIASEEAKRIPSDMIPMDISPGMEHHIGMLQRFPIGPVLGITPFNFPLNLVAHKVAPCLAAGNPIVIKPAPQTPLTACLLGSIILEAGLPPGSISILPCDNQVAETMVQDPQLQALSFTGSVAVGWMLKGKAGKKRVLLELGGNAGVIIEPDAHVEFAVQRCVTGGFSYSGQTCISVQRMYVHDHVYEAFLEQFLERVKGLSIGNPLEDSTIIGPLIDEKAASRVEQWIQEATSQGATVLLGGTRHGAIVTPTVLTDVTPQMKVSCDELFGPVVTITRYHEFEQALALLNDSPFGLQAGIFTQDTNKIFQAYRELDVGAVLANEVPTFRADHMPYGGIKDSGLGREGVRYAIQELTEPKLLIIHLPR